MIGRWMALLLATTLGCSEDPQDGTADTDATSTGATTSAGDTTVAPEDGTTSASATTLDAATASTDASSTAVDDSSGGSDDTTGAVDDCVFEPGDPAVPRVRIVYLVPSDRAVVDDYVDTLERAARDLQLWFSEHTGDGSTFELADPVVEIVQTAHEASWYSTNPDGDPYLWFWNNVLADAFPATGGGFDQPDNVWAYYIDADGACGQSAGSGTSGVVVLPANDLRGLAGAPNQPPCPGDPPDMSSRCRWVGGLGHELGHGFGRPHPPGCDAPDPKVPCDTSTLMWLGYTSYPDADLTADDQAALAQSPFFAPRTLPACSIDCSMP